MTSEELKEALEQIAKGEIYCLGDMDEHGKCDCIGVYVTKWINNELINAEASCFELLSDIIQALCSENAELKRPKTQYCAGCEERQRKIDELRKQLEEAREKNNKLRKRASEYINANDAQSYERQEARNNLVVEIGLFDTTDEVLNANPPQGETEVSGEH